MSSLWVLGQILMASSSCCCNGASQVALVVNNPPSNARDVGSIAESGRSPGGGHSKPLQYSYLKNFMDRGAWQLQSMGLQRDTTKWLSMHTHLLLCFLICKLRVIRVLSWRIQEGWNKNPQAPSKCSMKPSFIMLLSPHEQGPNKGKLLSVFPKTHP